MIGSGNEGLNVTWTGIDTSVTPDLQGYQVLCDRAGSLQVFANGTFGAGFRTCPSTPIPDGVNSHILGLDPNFTCSKMLTQTASSWRIKILQNDITYGVAVVAVDNSYNASAPTVFYGEPQKTLSFYDVYRNGDETNTMPGGMPTPGGASGGLCAVSGTRSRSAGAAGLAAIALVIGLALGARRRRRPRP